MRIFLTKRMARFYTSVYKATVWLILASPGTISNRARAHYTARKMNHIWEEQAAVERRTIGVRSWLRAKQVAAVVVPAVQRILDQCVL